MRAHEVGTPDLVYVEVESGGGALLSSLHPLPPIPHPGGPAAGAARSQRAARRRRWPAWVMLATSITGIAVAVFAWNTLVAQTRMTIAIGGFALVIVLGTAMLFVQRVLDVGVARTSGTPLISSFDVFEKLAFAVLLVASVANGIVIALQVARQ